MYDIVIVGAGIAGLTAAIYARRANKSVLVLEAKTYGGQIINTFDIENYPAMPGISGPELAQKLYDQATKLGAEIEFENVTEIKDGKEKIIKTEEGEYRARAIILAVGAEDKKMQIPREEEMTGRGVSYCATCDGALYKDKNVAVVGGGNTALYDALYLSDIAAQVYLVHRRNEFRGDATLLEKVKKIKNVELVLGFVPAEIIGEQKVTGLKLIPSGKVATIKEGRDLAVDGIFVAIGKKPATDNFKDLVDLDENGYIKAGEDCITVRTGIFAVGDCRTKEVRQLVTAAADGAIAAKEAIDLLKNKNMI